MLIYGAIEILFTLCAQAKKRQIQLDETYSTGVRELQEILCSLCPKNDSTSAVASNPSEPPLNIQVLNWRTLLNFVI